MRESGRLTAVAIVTAIAFVCTTTVRASAQSATDGGAALDQGAPAADGGVPSSVAPTDAGALPDAASTTPATIYLPPPSSLEPIPPAPAPASLNSVVIATPVPVQPKLKRRWGLFAAGVVLFAIGYGGNVGVTYAFGHTPSYTSAIPVFGPLIQFGEHFGLDGPPVDSGDPSYDSKINQTIDSGNTIARSLIYTALALDAAFQLAGVTMIILGAVLKKKPKRYSNIRPAPGGLAFTW